MQKPGELKKLSFSDSIYILLLEPKHSLNVGSVARAMMNLGFEHLILINPENYDISKAAVTARWAVPILERAVLYENIEDALSQFNDVIGFGDRCVENVDENISLPVLIEEYRPDLSGRTALLFGPEDRGLNKNEVNLCRKLVRIPSMAEYPSYNLSQAVLLVIYEFCRNRWDDKIESREARDMPVRNDYYQLQRMLDEVLTRTGFYRDGSPAPVPGVVKRLFQRMNPDKREMGILLAMINRINKNLQ